MKRKDTIKHNILLCIQVKSRLVAVSLSVFCPFLNCLTFLDENPTSVDFSMFTYLRITEFIYVYTYLLQNGRMMFDLVFDQI